MNKAIVSLKKRQFDLKKQILLSFKSLKDTEKRILIKEINERMKKTKGENNGK